MSKNKLFYGDCLTVLRDMTAESVDLVYLDPPFNSRRDYNAIFKSSDGSVSEAQAIAFIDTWHWGEQAQEEFNSLLHNTEAGALAEFVMPAFQSMMAQSDMMAYLVMMASRLFEIKRVMKPTASLYLHCDPTASHYLKILLDSIFGGENFRNEIIWKRTNAHNMKTKGYVRANDTIFYYTKSSDYTFNTQYTNYSEAQLSRYKEDEQGKLYKAENLTFSSRSPSRQFTWRGTTPPENRSWGASYEQLEKWWAEGRILIKKDGSPRLDGLKVYLDEMKGNPVTTNWTDIDRIGNTSAERLGYPTQKPVALLERIIKTSSNPGDIVLDPFCGCGTAIHASEKLGRTWIGIDITHLAIGLIKRRIHAAFPECKFEINGVPKDVEAARFLAESNGLEGRYQFQYWALSLVDGVASNDKKKGADSGADGFIWAYNSPAADKPFKINILVKSGKIPANHIRELAGMIGKNNIEMCLLLTLEEPSKKMLVDALSYGDYEYPNGKKFPKIQILTIKDLLDGKLPKYLDYGEGAAMPGKAKREITQYKRNKII